ncbi:unnamed protein product [Meloidogyne enterolobii]|uniref:Uncharacterized protein n=1 Tax=Meloidogyne enterolobii TaxID=390850 RepID=A0ACB1B2T6_MELEN
MEKQLGWEIHSLKTLIGHMYEKHGIDEGAKIFLNDILQPEELKEFIENICQAINYAENLNHLIQLLDGFMSENEKMLEKEKKEGEKPKELTPEQIEIKYVRENYDEIVNVINNENITTTGYSLREDIRNILGRLIQKISSQGKFYDYEGIEMSSEED